MNVHTAKKTGAGTDANVFLNIFGNQGDTGERPLMFSKTNRNKFEKGNVSQRQSLYSCFVKHILTNYSQIINNNRNEDSNYARVT